jgi:hypothetical protein
MHGAHLVGGRQRKHSHDGDGLDLLDVGQDPVGTPWPVSRNEDTSRQGDEAVPTDEESRPDPPPPHLSRPSLLAMR